MKLIQRQGFSIVEFLMAVAALAVVAFSISKLSTDMVRFGVTASGSQERSSAEQSLNSLFYNAEICTSILAGTTAVEGGSFEIPEALRVTESLRRLDFESAVVESLINMNNGNYRASLLVRGVRKDASGSHPFQARLPVYVHTSNGKILNCFSERSAYSTCVALNGIWNDTYCDFCTSLGGTRDDVGNCSVATVEPPVPPPPATPRFVELRRAGAYNGTYRVSVGSYEQCNLTRVIYDGDGIGECSLSRSGNSWTVTIGDEGSSNPQVCYMICVSVGTTNIGNGADGDLCTYSGRTGIMRNGCCVAGTTWRRNYVTSGVGKNRTTKYTGLTNDLGCF